ncbi:MAG: bifunctional phosphoglucose/phosphomannose isomerase [Patescibacteria group bacterium]
MFESIKNTKQQFLWEPVLNNAKAKEFKRIIVCGMGGSNIASGFLEMLRPDLDILAHRTYGLPATVSKNDLVILSSYSGNTEETLDSLKEAVSEGLNIVAIAAGGKLLDLAKEKNIPFIQIPVSTIQPRMALGYSLLAMLKAIGGEENIKKIHEFGKNFNPDVFEVPGRELAEKLQGKIPVIYSSWKNKSIAYAWKIKFNESAKIPAFFNVFPELNHNEMVGFLSFVATPEGVCGSVINPYFIFLKDSKDHPKVQKRMEITQKLLTEKGYSCHSYVFVDSHRVYKIFNSLTLADWVAYHIAKNFGINPEDSAIIEDFKNKIK